MSSHSLQAQWKCNKVRKCSKTQMGRTAKQKKNTAIISTHGRMMDESAKDIIIEKLLSEVERLKAGGAQQ